MKGRILLACTALLAMASCKEKGPIVDFGAALATDTTYTTTPASPQLRNVLIEDFTGMECVNCPEGHKLVQQLEVQYPGRIVPMAEHTYNLPLASPIPSVSPLDFRTSAATDLFQTIYGSPSVIPFAGIDRVPYAGVINVGTNSWAVAVAGRIGTAAPVNLSIASVYDAGSNTANVKVIAAYTSTVAKKQSFSLALVEDTIIGPQKYYDANANSATDTFYVHNHVLRRMYTPSLGSNLLDSLATKAPGRVYERTFSIALDPSWKPQHCKIVAIIANNETGDREVQQAAEAAVKP